jgi:hypothetical protein
MSAMVVVGRQGEELPLEIISHNDKIGPLGRAMVS